MRKLIYFILFLVNTNCFSQVENRGGGGTDIRATVKGEKRALIVGISDYEHNPLDLTYADDDANLFKDYLLNVDKVKEENIIFLENKDAYAQAIYQGIDEMIKVSKSGDEVYVYFAGHGDVVNREEEKIGFLLAHDANGGRNYRGTDGVVALAALNTFINTLTSSGVKVILVLDACHSGFIYEEGAKTNMLTLSDGNNFMNTTKLLSCAPTQTSQEDASIGHGFFTYYLVMGMMGAADIGVQDNKLKYNELDDYVYESVANETHEQQEPFMISGIRRKVFKNLSSKHKEIALKAQEKSVFLKDAVRSARSSSDKLKLKIKKLTQEQDLFNEALKANKLHSVSNSAIDILKNIESQGSLNEVALSRMKFMLSRKLTSSGNRLINLYISGPKDLPLGKEFLKESNNIKVALELLDKNHPTRKALEVSRRFLEAYSYIRDEDYGNYEKAKGLLQEALTLESKAAYVLNALGILANENSNFKVASNYYKEAIELIPTWSYPVNNLGSNYFEQYDYINATKYYNKAIQINKESLTPKINLAAISSNIGKDTEALLKNLELIKKGVNSYTVYTNTAIILEEKGNIRAAQKYFKAALKKYPKSPYLLIKYSKFIKNNGLTQLKHEPYLLKALEIQPNYANAITEYADYLRISKGDEEALEESEKLYRKAIKKNPYYIWSYAGLAYLLNTKGKEAEAIESFELGIKNNPEKVEGLYYYAQFKKEKLKDTEGAIKLYQEILQKNPYYKYAYEKLSYIYLSKGEEDKAINLIKGYITVAGENPISFKLMGDFYSKQKNFNEAAKYYQKSVDLDPYFTKGTVNLAYTYLELEEYDKAKQLYIKAHQENPGKYPFSTFQGTIYRKYRKLHRSGNKTTSLKLLQLAYEIEKNIEANYKYAFNLYLRGNTLKAFKILNEVIPAKGSWVKKYKVLKTKLFIDLEDLKNASILYEAYKNENAITDKALELLLTISKGNKKEAQKQKTEINKLFISNTRLKKNYSAKAIEKINKI